MLVISGDNLNNKVLGIINIATSLIIAIVALIFVNQSVALTDEKIFSRNIDKVVEIRISSEGTTFAYGTGCFIDSDGTILTNKHIVYNQSLGVEYSIVQVRLPTEENFIDAKVVQISNDSDIAIIKVDKINTSHFKMNFNAKDGQTVYTIGNPNGMGLSFIKGNISSKLRNIVYNDVLVEVLQTSFVINEGNSGGPVFDKNGELLGIISFRLKTSSLEVLQGISFAVPSFKIKDFLSLI